MLPDWVTVFNEPSGWSGAELAKATRVLSDMLKEQYPNIKIGGPTYAWPHTDLNYSFKEWENTIKEYIDGVGNSVDFYDMHMYTKAFWAQDGSRVKDPFTFASERETKVDTWETGKLELFYDLIEAYQFEKWGTVKPILATEFGNQSIQPQTGPWENEFKPFMFMNTIMDNWMRFVERPEVELSIPFILTESPNSLRGMALLNKTYGGWTRFKDFYEMVKDLKGERIPLTVEDSMKSSSRNIMARAFKDGENVYVWLHNNEYPIENTTKVNLETILPKGKNGEPLEVLSAGIKRMKWQGEIPYPHNNPNPDGLLTIDKEFKDLNDFSEISMVGMETSIIKLTLSENIRLDKVQTEEVFYAPQTLLDASQPTTLTVHIPEREGHKNSLRSGWGYIKRMALKKIR